MFSDIGGVRAALKDRLAPLLPATWTIEKNLKNPPTEYRRPLVTFEFTRFASTAGGADLPRGSVAAEIDIVLGSPSSTDEDGLDQLALTLIQAIDSQSDLFWDTAEKGQLPGNQWCWRIHTTVITKSKE